MSLLLLLPSVIALEAEQVRLRAVSDTLLALEIEHGRADEVRGREQNQLSVGEALDGSEVEVFWARARWVGSAWVGRVGQAHCKAESTVVEATPGVRFVCRAGVDVSAELKLERGHTKLLMERNQGRWKSPGGVSVPAGASHQGFGPAPDLGAGPKLPPRPQPPPASAFRSAAAVPVPPALPSLPLVKPKPWGVRSPPKARETKLKLRPRPPPEKPSSGRVGRAKAPVVRPTSSLSELAKALDVEGAPLKEAVVSAIWTADARWKIESEVPLMTLSTSLRNPRQGVPQRELARLGLASASPSSAKPSRRKSLATFEPASLRAKKRKSVASFVPTAPAPASQRIPPSVLTYIGFQHLRGTSRVFLRFEGRAEYRTKNLQGGAIVHLELLNCSVNVENNTRPLDTSYFPGPVTYVRAQERGKKVVVEIRLREAVSPEIKRIGRTLAADFRTD